MTELKDKIKARIQEIEKTTCIEFVPVYLKTSSDYLEFRIYYSMCMALLGTACFETFSHYSIRSWILGTAGGFIFFILLRFFPPLLSLLIPRFKKHKAVEDAASHSFLKHEVFTTKKRTGILILVSEFEKMVFILADKGFEGKVESAQWSQLGAKLAYDFATRTAGETFLSALDELMMKIAPAFPPELENPNELSDEVRVT